MLNFTQHLILEMAALSSEAESDDKGKLHELLLARHLNPDKDENGEGKLPLHHRAESENEDHAGSPQQVHDRLRAKVGEAVYNEINGHAKQTAAAVQDHIKKNGYMKDGHEIESVHWTSNRDTDKKEGDHKKTTGVLDPNANGDLIITTRNKKNHQDKNYIPISAKYGTEEEPNYKNAGLKSLAQQAGYDNNAYTDLLAAHTEHMGKIGYQGTQKVRHQQYKLDKATLKAEREQAKIKGENPKKFQPKSKEAKRAAEGEKSSLDIRKEMARMHENGLGGLSDPELRQHIRDQVAPPTIYPHIIAHSHVQDDGSAISRTENAEDHADHHLANYKNIRIRPGSGITSDFVGDDHTGKTVVIARQGFKGGSGPHKGVAGFFKLEGTKREEKAAKKAGKPAPAPTTVPKSTGPKRVKQSFVQHVAPKAPVKKKKAPVSKPFPHPVSKDVPDSVWADKAPSGEVGGVQFKSKSEME